MYQIEELKNGVKLLRIAVSGIESVSTVVLVKTGSRYEKFNQYGLAHFLEHMVFKGTKIYPNTKILSETVDSIGAQFNAFTSEEATAFYIRSAATHLDLNLKVLGQLITQPLILPQEIEKEKGVILEEMHMYEDQPASYNTILFNEMFYQGSGLAHNILGKKETVASFKQKDFFNFMDSWYQAGNILIVVAGKKAIVESPDLGEKILENFPFKTEPKIKIPQHQETWQKNFIYGEKINLYRKKTEQIHFILGWPGLNIFDPREDVLSLLSTIVGGNMSSRLFLQVREQRGLCYYINSQVEAFADAGFFGAVAGVNPSKVSEALRVTIDQFEALSEGRLAVTEEELDKAKNYLAGNLVLAQESTHSLAISYGLRQILTGRVQTVQDKLKSLKKVNLTQVKDLAKELVKSKELRLSVIGQIDQQTEKEIRSLIKV